MKKTPIAVIIAFHRNPRLVTRLGARLVSLAKEWRAQSARVVLIDDSPGYAPTSRALRRLRDRLPGAVLIVNETNLGYLRSCNRGLALARREGWDALLLNSDTLPTPGALRELRAVAALDPMIGFVCPRTNHGVLCSLPTDEINPIEEAAAFRRYRSVARHLPRWGFTPVGVGFCLLVKAIVLREIGLLDEAFCPGYFEEMDLCVRAGRAGFRTALANRAFVWHEGSASFGGKRRDALNARNAALFNRRYPTFWETFERHRRGPEHEHERLLSARREGRPRLLFDLSHLGCWHNGTAKVSAAWLNAMARRREFTVAALGTREVARFHGIAEAIPVFPADTREAFDVVFLTSQPFRYSDIERVSRLAPHQFYLMHDTIAADCVFSDLATPELTPLWRFVAEHADGIVFVSESSREQFLRRYGPRVKMSELVCPLSLSAKDFRAGAPGTGGGILVLGNRFKHKYVDETVERLVERFPERRVTAVGLSASRWPNVRALTAGAVDSEEIETLFREAEMVIYPSLYEGFGLPIAEALAWNKRVLARNLPPAREIAAGWNGGGSLELYDDTDALLSLIALPGPCALLRNARSWDWEDGAAALSRFFLQTMARDPGAKVCRARLRTLDSLRALAEPARVDLEKHRHGLAAAERLRDITSVETRSGRRVMGRVVDRVRRQLGAILFPVFHRQSEHNRAVGETLAWLSAKLDRIEESSRDLARAESLPRERGGVPTEPLA